MAEQTEISWADGTFNPWEGCQETGSPACVFCYAKTRNARFNGGVAVNWGPHAPRRRTSAANWRKLALWNRDPSRLNPPPGTKPFIFGGSLCDPFDNAVPEGWRHDYFDEINAAPNLVVLLLTKRPQNIERMARAWMRDRLGGDATPAMLWPRNIAIGCTVVTQEEADRDVPHLLKAAAALAPAFVFLSMEPLAEPVNLRKLQIATPKGFTKDEAWAMDALKGRIAPVLQLGNGEWELDGGGRYGPKVDWVICGGESGPRARPSDEEWYLDLERQADGAGTAFHFKQRGGRDKEKGGKLLAGRVRQERPVIPA